MTTAQTSGIVTPEAVVLEFDTAGVGSRMIAEILDLLMQLVGAWSRCRSSLSFAVTGGLDLGQTLAVVLTLVLTFLILVGYPIAMETLWNGRTLGKAAMGLRVVTQEGGPIRFRHAAIRGIFGLIEIWIFLGSIAVVAIIFTKRNQRVGDLVAGTIVLRERSARAPVWRGELPAAARLRGLCRVARRHADLGRAVLADPRFPDARVRSCRRPRADDARGALGQPDRPAHAPHATSRGRPGAVPGVRRGGLSAAPRRTGGHAGTGRSGPVRLAGRATAPPAGWPGVAEPVPEHRGPSTRP